MKNDINVEKRNAFIEKITAAWRCVKDAFYDLNVSIHNLFGKIFPRKKEKTIRSGQIGAAIFAHLLVLYPLLQFIVFYVIVNFNSIALSFQKFNLDTGSFELNGLETLKAVFIDLSHDTLLKYCTKNSLISYIIGLAIGFPIHLTFSYVIYKKVPFSGFFQTVLFLPQILSSIVMSLMFMRFTSNALPEFLLAKFGIEKFDLLYDVKTAFGTVLFYSIWSGFGTQLILYAGAMSRIPDSIIEFGELEGISMWKEFWHVCLPMIYPTITIFLVTGIAGIFTSQLNLFNFYGKEARMETRTLGYHFYIMVLDVEGSPSYLDYPYAAASGLIFSLVAAPVTLIARHLLEKYGPTVEF